MKSKMINMGKWSYIKGNIRVDLDLSPLDERVQKAQRWLGDRVLEDCRSCMPHRTGSLQQRSHTENGGRAVVFPSIYARYLYGGKVMVDKDTGKGPMKISDGPGGAYKIRFRKGAKLIPTSRPLTYSNPQAVPEWFEVAKERHGHFWVKGVKDIVGGKK